MRLQEVPMVTEGLRPTKGERAHVWKCLRKNGNIDLPLIRFNNAIRSFTGVLISEIPSV